MPLTGGTQITAVERPGAVGPFTAAGGVPMDGAAQPVTQTIPVSVASTAITMQMTAVAPPETQQGGALHVLRSRGVDVNDAVLQTHSVEYAETAIIQSGHSVVGAEVTGNIWTNRKLDFLMKWFERNDPTLAAHHDELIRKHGAGIVTRDTEVWMNYDIILDVAPFAAIPSATAGKGP